MKKMFFLMILTSMISADLISIDIGIMQLSLFRILVIGLFFELIYKYIRDDKKIKLNNNLRNRWLMFFMFWNMYALISIVWIKDIQSWLQAFFYLTIGIMTIINIQYYIDDLKSFKRVLKLIVLMNLFHNIIGYYEIITGRYYFADLSKIDRYNIFSSTVEARTPISMFGNINDFATFLVFSIFMSLIYISLT